MLYPYALEFASRLLKSDLLILPSSVNEVLLIPYEKTVELEQMGEMVRSVNITSVPPEEVLSDCVYCFKRRSNLVEVIVGEEGKRR